MTRRRGYADGGQVGPPPRSPLFEIPGLSAARKAIQDASAELKPQPSGDPPRTPPGKARGGKITKVAGKPVGKDDGMIPAKRGEYVVRKSSTTKYGPAKMAAVNKGTAKVTARGKR